MKKFFNISGKYQFEVNDLHTAIQLINVVLVMIYGLIVSWFGLAVSVGNLIYDVINPNRRISHFLMHLSTMILNIYFLTLLYK